jgi:hypothetical protein
VQRLLGADGVSVASLPSADALVARIPVLNKRVLPAGVADLERKIPPTDVVLVASKASLVVRRDLDPALMYLLLDAAREIHAAPGIFHQAGEFPALDAVDLPIADEAEMFDKRGPPFLQRHLPFGLAVLTERVALALIPLVGILFPVLRVFPSVRTWYVQRRLALFYKELKLLDVQSEVSGKPASGPDLIRKLDELEARVSRLRVPEEFTALVYGLRHHIRLVRERLEPAQE